MGRVHTPASFKAANTASANGHLLIRDGVREHSEPSASDQLAAAANAANRRDQKRGALLVREADQPLSRAVGEIVQMLRYGRVRIEDLEQTQRMELDQLQGVMAADPDSATAQRLKVATSVRAEALSRVHADPYLAVMSPVRVSVGTSVPRNGADAS